MQNYTHYYYCYNLNWSKTDQSKRKKKVEKIGEVHGRWVGSCRGPLYAVQPIKIITIIDASTNIN